MLCTARVVEVQWRLSSLTLPKVRIKILKSTGPVTSELILSYF